jgi:chitinase
MKRVSIFNVSVWGLSFLLSGVRCASAQSVPACASPWTAGMSVTVGEVVSYNGENYRALQAETFAVSNWQPPNVPALWTLVGACGSSTTTPPPPPPPPSNPPPTNPPPTSGSGNGRVLIGYWHDFSNGSVNLPLAQVSSNFDVIDVAFAGTTTDTSTISFDVDTVDIESEAQFIEDVATLQGKGKKVILSIGGANGNVALNTAQDVTNFVNSVSGLIQKFGFNGVDIDIENNSFALISGDNDFTNPKTPTTVNMINALHQLASKFPGFMLSFAPQIADIQEANVAYVSTFGDQLPLVWGCRDIMSFLQVQDYNTGGTNALDGKNYTEGTADFQVAMTELLLHGFTLANGQNFPGFPPGQIAFGVPASTSAGGGFTAPSAVEQALNYLITGVPFGGQYVLQNPAGYPGLRGLMTFSINWDDVNGFALSNTIAPYLHGLPAIAAPQ